MKRIIILFSLFSLLAVPAYSFAFNPDYLISDEELTDPFALDRNQIQHFLNRGFLGAHITEDWEGKSRYATDIISIAAQNVGISPKFLLVLLQKEQSLVEDDDPTQNQLDWATGYAVCDDCSKDDPAIQRWKGFGKQINSAALQFTEGYLADIQETGTTQGKYGPGVDVEIDDTTVTPANAATAALYAYTPHLHGNENFVTIWQRWFETLYPTGSLLQSDTSDNVYLIEYGYKRPIQSMSALLSRFNAELIITVSQNQIDNYPDGRSIDFPNYTLLQDENGGIYLLVDDSLRHIDSMETFRHIGFSMDEVVEIDNIDLALFDAGEPITLESLYPQGNLLELETNGAVFFIQDGERHAILDPEILNAHFLGQPTKPVLPVIVEQYKEGKPLLLPDGYLVKGAENPDVYVISEGVRRSIPSEDVFLAYGWSWNDIVTIDDAALKIHPTGLPIETPSYVEVASE
jgi:hypothetical protein